jgi:hypothetical protein
MIIWRGWGILVLVIAGLGAGAGHWIAVALGANPEGPNVGTALGLLLAAVGIWYVGARVNAPKQGFDPNSGQPAVHRNAHTLFFVPMQWLAPVIGVGAIAMGVAAATG